MTPFNASTIAAEYLGLVAGDNTRRDAIVAWTHGDAGTERADKRMGSIYHSSPVVIGATRGRPFGRDLQRIPAADW
jgi:hypothetical protein